MGDDDIIEALGIVSSFLLAMEIFMVVYIYYALWCRDATWNILGAMQSHGGSITFNDWKVAMASINGNGSTEEEVLDAMESHSYKTIQPPRVGEDDYANKANVYKIRNNADANIKKIDATMQMYRRKLDEQTQREQEEALDAKIAAL